MAKKFIKPDWLEEDFGFYYCPENKFAELEEMEQFVPLGSLLSFVEVSNAVYNVMGQIEGKNVLVLFKQEQDKDMPKIIAKNLGEK